MKSFSNLCSIVFFGIAFAIVVAPNMNAQDVAQSQNSFRPGELWFDESGVPINAHGAGLLRWDDRFWLFGEHKVEGAEGNFAQVGVHCYSSPDLYNWKDEGIALKVEPKDSGSPISQGCILERPKVVYNEKTKKFVMWFHLESSKGDYKDATSGVAIADSVAGPYRFIRAERPNKGDWPCNVDAATKKPLAQEERADVDKAIKDGKIKTGYTETYRNDVLYRYDFERGQDARDMTVFKDDDGKAYHIYSSESNGVLHIAPLSDDYLRHEGEYARAFPGRFYEGPAIFKRNGKYYIFASDCTGWDPNEARLAVADNIMGPWKELGNPCRGTDEQRKYTFESQSSYVLSIPEKDVHIFIADRWRPQNAIDGRYVWLPIQFDEDGVPYLEWRDEWRWEEK